MSRNELTAEGLVIHKVPMGGFKGHALFGDALFLEFTFPAVVSKYAGVLDSVVYNTNSCQYKRIANIIFFAYNVNVTITTSKSVQLQISLPFEAASQATFITFSGVDLICYRLIAESDFLLPCDNKGVAISYSSGTYDFVVTGSYFIS